MGKTFKVVISNSLLVEGGWSVEFSHQHSMDSVFMSMDQAIAYACRVVGHGGNGLLSEGVIRVESFAATLGNRYGIHAGQCYHYGQWPEDCHYKINQTNQYGATIRIWLECI